MSDRCHCPEPHLMHGENGTYCTICHMWYDHQAWLKDSRRLTLEQRMAKTGRNDSCPCGSGKKFKKCCLK